MRLISHAIAGILFATGLVVSGMTQPSKVVGFLDFFGNWDPSLMFVMVGAISVHFVFYRLIMNRPSPVFSDTFHLPTRRDIDKKLVVGAALFGAGWGLAGFCPGPALTSLVTLETNNWIFGISMVSTMYIYGLTTRVSQKRQEKRFERHREIPMNQPSIETGS